MKQFKKIFVLICISLGIRNVSPRNIDPPANLTCENELWELKQQYQSCAPANFDMPRIIDRITEYRNKTVNSTIFSRTITNYCTTLKSAASCSLGKSTIISVTCRDQVQIQFFLNLMRVINRIADDLCSEEIILAIASDKGFNCFDPNELANCAFYKLPNQVKGGGLQDKNVCRTTEFLVTCTNEIFDMCQNDGIIKTYVHQMLSGLRKDFSCQ